MRQIPIQANRKNETRPSEIIIAEGRRRRQNGPLILTGFFFACSVLVTHFDCATVGTRRSRFGVFGELMTGKFLLWVTLLYAVSNRFFFSTGGFGEQRK